MPAQQVAAWDDCREFRQVILAQPPVLAHGAAVLLVSLIAAALAWASAVEADVVIKGRGHLRPLQPLVKVFTPALPSLEGRVAEIHVREGDLVRRGDVLLQIDCTRLDNEIAKQQRTIEASEEELASIEEVGDGRRRQLESAEEKAVAEIRQAQAELAAKEARRASRIRQAQAEVEAARDALNRTQTLVRHRAATQQQLVQSRTELRLAEEAFQQAQLPLDCGSAEIIERELEVVRRNYAVEMSELDARRAVLRGAVQAARRELDDLLLQRGQAVLRAPVDGVVVAGEIRRGDVLERGRPVLRIAPQGGFSFEAVVSNADVGRLRRGMNVRVAFDAFDRREYGAVCGRVSFISPDANAVGDPDPGAGYLVRIPLEETSSNDKLCGKLKLGMSGGADLVLERRSLLSLFVRGARGAISLGSIPTS